MATSAALIGVGACWTTIAAAQTAELAADVDRVIQTLASAGVTDREEVLGALEAAWAAERDQEYALLRRLGITPTDAEFDGAWQNQPGRALQFVHTTLKSGPPTWSAPGPRCIRVRRSPGCSRYEAVSSWYFHADAASSGLRPIGRA
jgi:hypothetical protein